MRLPSPLVCIVLALGLCRGAWAIDLYVARVPLAESTDAARTAAVTNAFARVLEQVAGRAEVGALAHQPDGRSAAARALLSYALSTGDDGTQALEARFDPGLVRGFLSARQQARPAEARPTLLLWLLAQRAGAPAWVGADEPAELAATVSNAAAARGLPLLLPVLDLTERAALPASVDPTDPSSLAALTTASARYRPDGVLFGRLRTAGKGWEATLRLTLPEHADVTWSAHGDNETAALAAALDGVGQHLAPAATVAGGPPAAVQITVDGISDIEAYARVWRHLKQAPGVRMLRPLALSGARSVFGFELAGGSGALPGSVEPGAPFARSSADSPSYRYSP